MLRIYLRSTLKRKRKKNIFLEYPKIRSIPYPYVFAHEIPIVYRLEGILYCTCRSDARKEKEKIMSKPNEHLQDPSPSSLETM